MLHPVLINNSEKPRLGYRLSAPLSAALDTPKSAINTAYSVADGIWELCLSSAEFWRVPSFDNPLALADGDSSLRQQLPEPHIPLMRMDSHDWFSLRTSNEEEVRSAKLMLEKICPADTRTLWDTPDPSSPEHPSAVIMQTTAAGISVVIWQEPSLACHLFVDSSYGAWFFRSLEAIR
ncbi:MAG: hypothetical protein K0U36_06690 [Alphaproteobacteria bacterium]|nr:hypothetical protein [Alphaproteobacteria bacterium]